MTSDRPVTHLPPGCPVALEVDGTTVVLAPGTPEAAFGDVLGVQLPDGTAMRLFVAAVDSATFESLAPDVVALFAPTVAKLHRAMIQAACPWRFTPDMPVTLYTLVETPVEEWTVEEDA